MPQEAENVPKTDAAHGVGKTTDQADLTGPKKTAPLPEGLNEVNDGTHSGGGSQGLTGVGSGAGGHEPKTMGEKKGANIGIGPGPANNV